MDLHTIASDLVSHWVSELIILLVGLGMAWLKKRGSSWLPVVSYGLGGSFLAACIIYAVTGHAVFSQKAPTTTPENIEANIKTWCDNFGMSVQKQNINPSADFILGITIPSNGRKFMVSRFKERERYLQFQADLPVSKEHEAIMSKFSGDQNAQVNHEVNLELARSKIGFVIVGSTGGMTAPIKGVMLVASAPITENLTEDVFMAHVNEMDSGIALAGEAVSFAIQHNRTKPHLALLQ